jgi:hypothetical protein
MMVGSKRNHTFLAAVFGARKHEYTVGFHTVLKEQFGLILGLGEIFKHHAWAYLFSQGLN